MSKLVANMMIRLGSWLIAKGCQVAAKNKTTKQFEAF